MIAAGPVSMRYQVQNLLVTLQDDGGNVLPPPALNMFAFIEAQRGSTATVTAAEGGSKQLRISKTGGHLKVEPFCIASTTAGETLSGNHHNTSLSPAQLLIHTLIMPPTLVRLCSVCSSQLLNWFRCLPGIHNLSAFTCLST